MKKAILSLLKMVLQAGKLKKMLLNTNMTLQILLIQVWVPNTPLKPRCRFLKDIAYMSGLFLRMEKPVIG